MVPTVTALRLARLNAVTSFCAGGKQSRWIERWRGGLMHYAESRGLAAIVARLTDMAAAGMAAPPPCERLVQAAESGRCDP